MKIKELLKTLEQSKEFKDWKKLNKDSYFVHIFIMSEQGNQIGYYNPKNNKITSFIIEEQIKIMPEEEPFKKEKTKIKPLDIEKVKIDYDKALETANNLQKEKFSEHKPVKTIAILQNIENKDLWNITFITQSFNTLNIKVDAATNKIIEHKLTPLMQFKAG